MNEGFCKYSKSGGHYMPKERLTKVKDNKGRINGYICDLCQELRKPPQGVISESDTEKLETA